MYNFDNLTTKQIKELINNNLCTNQDVVNYYKNTHSEKDFEDLLTFSEEEIEEIYNEIFEMSK